MEGFPSHLKRLLWDHSALCRDSSHGAGVTQEKPQERSDDLWRWLTKKSMHSGRPVLVQLSRRKLQRTLTSCCQASKVPELTAAYVPT